MMMNNSDERKQWAPLHYAVDANNMHIFTQLTRGEKKFRCGKSSAFSFVILHIFLHSDINLNGGNGENVLHIAAHSQHIWKDVSFIVKISNYDENLNFFQKFRNPKFNIFWQLH